jgi:hypothetical protein
MATLLWKKITDQYTSHSVVNCGQVLMQWSNLAYNGNLQDYIDKTRSLLLDIESVDIAIPKELISYSILGKLLNHDLKQIIDCIALSPDCIQDPYLVLNALQTFQTHKLNQESGVAASALISATSKKFLVKVVPLGGFGDHNPEVTSHDKCRCFERYTHLKKAQQPRTEQKKCQCQF